MKHVANTELTLAQSVSVALSRLGRVPSERVNWKRGYPLDL